MQIRKNFPVSITTVSFHNTSFPKFLPSSSSVVNPFLGTNRWFGMCISNLKFGQIVHSFSTHRLIALQSSINPLLQRAVKTAPTLRCWETNCMETAMRLVFPSINSRAQPILRNSEEDTAPLSIFTTSLREPPFLGCSKAPQNRYK